MSERPEVKKGDWVDYGDKSNPFFKKLAIVSDVYEDEIEVVYLNEHERPMSEWMRWKEDRWNFYEPSVLHAGKHLRFNEYIQKLYERYPTIRK
jgi:hypothetical protein